MNNPIFNYGDVYPGYKGNTLADEAVPDANMQQTLAQDGDNQITTTAPKNAYNITSAFVALVIIIILLQVIR